MPPSFVDRFLNELSASSERVMQVIQEGTSILLESSDMSKHGEYSTGGDSSHYESMDYSPLGDIANNVMDELLQGQVGPQGFLEHVQAFQSAINWREPLILCLISFHIAILLLSYFVIKNGGTASRLVLLIILSLLVRSAEWINGKCAQNWQYLASQNYFDPRGIFASIFFSSPLLLISFGMLISYLLEARLLIRELNVQKFQRKAKLSTKSKKAAPTGSRKMVDLKQD